MNPSLPLGDDVDSMAVPATFHIGLKVHYQVVVSRQFP